MCWEGVCGGEGGPVGVHTTTPTKHLIPTCHPTSSLHLHLSVSHTHTHTHSLRRLMGRARCLLDVAGTKRRLLRTDRQERRSRRTGRKKVLGDLREREWQTDIRGDRLNSGLLQLPASVPPFQTFRKKVLFASQPLVEKSWGVGVGGLSQCHYPSTTLTTVSLQCPFTRSRQPLQSETLSVVLNARSAP